MSLRDVDDECTDVITLLNIWIPIYGNINRKIFICANGLVSFGEKYTNPRPPRNLWQLGDRTLLAPFYADAIVTEEARIFFRYADASDPDILQSNDTRKAEELINMIQGTDSFSAKFVLFVTWYRVRRFDNKAASNEHATFQLVLLTNGVDTYVLYVYNKMRWSLPQNEPPEVWIGFRATGGYQATDINSFQREAFQIDQHVESKGIPSVLLYRLTPVGVGPSNDAILCLDWYNYNKSRRDEISNILRGMPECPCSLDRLVFDPWYMETEPSVYPNTVCVKIWPAKIFRPHGKTCCYDTVSRLWTDDYPRAGGYIDYHPFVDPAQHQIQDQNAKVWCCEGSNLCDFYYLFRPVGVCYRETWFEFGTLWGDPHFRTLDGKTFIFNGFGEYTMLDLTTETANFTLQARTERAVIQKENKEPILSYATIFSAFAAKDHDDTTLHVELNKAKTGINLYGNDIDLTTNYYTKHSDSDPFKYQADEGNLIITRRGNTLMALFPSSGIALNVSLGIQMLTVKIIVPKKYKGMTTGLLGNFDGNPSNDFTLPNGTVLPENIRENIIFQYGSEWSIDGSSSVFKYPDGHGHADFANDSYVPRFLDDVETSRYEAAVLECGSEEFLPCIFDFIFTENAEVAMDTKMTNETVVETQEEVENDIPSISGCETVRIEPGKEVTCQFTVRDDGTDLQIKLFTDTGNAEVISFDGSNSGVLQYTQLDLNPVELSITVEDKHGRQAPPVHVHFIVCTSCHGQGNCSDTEFKEDLGRDTFKYQKCICEPYYQGHDCEADFDGCAADPCSHGRTCTDLTAADHKAEQRAYTCSPCNEIGGYIEDGEKCIDVNECDDDSDDCDQLCVNTDGSYKCSCEQGYRQSVVDKSKCEDINECNEGSHNCQQVCSNIPGLFNCSCFDGFSFNEAKLSCEQVSDPCASIGLDCSLTDGCTNSSGTPTCVCSTGYQLTEQGNMCTDVDECSQNICPQGCVNNEGGFLCICWAGYRPSLTDPNSCEVCEFPFFGEGCTEICRCTGPGSVRCDPIYGCICNSFWTGESCDVDIDECEENPNICNDPYKQCLNAQGSYACSCIRGFQLSDISDPHSSCIDIDECKTPDLNDCAQTCVNAIGGYSCDCFDGFYLDENSGCTDVNECNSGVSGCQHLCENKPGFFNCYCYFGFVLNDDRKTCEKAIDPCKTFSDLQCQDICVVGDNIAHCECSQGFRLAADQQSCIDVNECSSASTNLCDHKELCANQNGSFTCSCREGWRLQNDKRSCTACDEFHYGLNCDSRCDCAVGAERCDSKDGCQCKTGWTGDKCELDKDECSTADDKCTGKYTVCKNLPGSYSCECMSGYLMNQSGLCEDIDECSDVTRHHCDQICTNTIGSFTCSCRTGFILNNSTCQDIDECIGENNCTYRCSNTIGGYRCTCPDGFQLLLEDRRSCIANDQCSDVEIERCFGLNADCYMLDNTPTCKCKKGFEALGESSDSCTDINECEEDPVPCSQICTNKIGSFQCSCMEGYELDIDFRTCKRCRDWTYGQACRQSCTCDVERSVSCNATDGTCYCLDGWVGANCNTDKDECKDESLHTCPDNSFCMNNDGSYTCKCNIGYFKTGDGNCTGCSRFRYGQDCAMNCPCNTTNTARCDNVNGRCTCLRGWTGDVCEDDIDECKESAENACTGNNTVCINLPGSFQCTCDEGYYQLDGQCSDVLECLEGIANCSQVCSDVAGGYACSCATGYEGYWNNCTACSNNRHGQNCSAVCDCNSDQTVDRDQMCDTVSGDCICKEVWEGTRCEVDVNECERDDVCSNFTNTGCLNKEGNFSCDCLRGFILQEGYCIQGPEPPVTEIGPDDVSIPMVITTEVRLTSYQNPEVASVYAVVKALLEEMLQDAYGQNVTVTDLNSRTGLLVVSYNVTIKNEDTTLTEVAASTLNVVQGSVKLRYHGEEVNIINATINDHKLGPEATLCEVFIAITRPCNSGELCKEIDGKPVCSPAPIQDSFALIVGLSVGGSLLLIIFTVMVLCVRVMRRKSNERKLAERSAQLPLGHINTSSKDKAPDLSVKRNLEFMQEAEGLRQPYYMEIEGIHDA